MLHREPIRNVMDVMACPTYAGSLNFHSCKSIGSHRHPLSSFLT